MKVIYTRFFLSDIDGVNYFSFDNHISNAREAIEWMSPYEDESGFYLYKGGHRYCLNNKNRNPNFTKNIDTAIRFVGGDK